MRTTILTVLAILATSLTTTAQLRDFSDYSTLSLEESARVNYAPENMYPLDTVQSDFDAIYSAIAEKDEPVAVSGATPEMEKLGNLMVAENISDDPSSEKTTNPTLSDAELIKKALEKNMQDLGFRGQVSDEYVEQMLKQYGSYKKFTTSNN